MLLFKFLPLTCNPCLSCLFISVCTAFPPCVCSAPSCEAEYSLLCRQNTVLGCWGFYTIPVSCYYHFPLFRLCWLQLFLSCTSCRYPLHVYLGAVFIHPVLESKCSFQFVVWKIVCSLENGGFSAFSSSLILPVLNQGQQPWESNPKGVSLGCCHSSLGNGKEKCTSFPLMQAD